MIEDMPVARAALKAGDWPPEREVGRVTLDWEQRRRRRIRLTMDGADRRLLLDLPRAGRLRDGDGLAIAGGGFVRVVAALEPVLEIRAGSTSLARLAYHLGNRHLPLQISADVLIAPRDPAAADLARSLGGEAREGARIFEPELGAYGHHADS
jgi:urease accessory protein